MSIKTIRMIPTLIVVGGLGIAAMIVIPSLRPVSRDKPDPYVILTVTFDPRVRSGERPPGRTLIDTVTVEVLVGSKAVVPPGPVNRSPWDATIRVRKGDTVTLRAEQAYGTQLTCRIRQPEGPEVTKPRNGPGPVKCVLQAV